MEEIIMFKITRYIILVFAIILICIIGITIVVRRNYKVTKDFQNETISYIEYEDYNELALKLAEKMVTGQGIACVKILEKSIMKKMEFLGKCSLTKLNISLFIIANIHLKNIHI